MGAVVVYIALLWASTVHSYNIRNHPCCQEPAENVTLAMIIDAFEIYGHDPTDKLDHLAHYQIEMMKVKRAPDQYIINEHVHIATDHLARFIHMHIKELKVLLIALDDVIDNMLTMYDNHNTIKTERVDSYYSTQSGGVVPSEFYLSQEFYCGKNVYVFVSELYSDIYNMGKGPSPYCKGRAFHFLGFVHYLDDKRYFLEEDPNVVFEMDNYIHGLECHVGVCIFRFPFKKNLQHERDVSTLPKAIVKCGTIMYKLPPLTAASCIITSGSFILDFNIQGLRFRHYDYLLTLPNGAAYYTKEKFAPLICDHHVCEWNHTNFYGEIPDVLQDTTLLVNIPSHSTKRFLSSFLMRTARKWDALPASVFLNGYIQPRPLQRPFIIPGDPGDGMAPIPPYLDQTTEAYHTSTEPPRRSDTNNTDVMEGCWLNFPPNYGSIAGVSYLDSLTINEYRFTCQGSGTKGLYWYPQWMASHRPFSQPGDLATTT